MNNIAKPLNVLQLTISFENGGRKEAIKNLAVGLKSAGHRVFLGCVSHRGTDEDLSSIFEQTTVFSVTKLFDFNAAARLADFCKINQIDIIHTHDAKSLFYSSLAKWSLKQTPPQIMTFHRSLNFETAKLRNKIRNVFSLLVCEGVITVSNARGRDYIASNLIKPKRLQLINLSADTTRFSFSLDVRERIRQEFGILPSDIVCGAMGHFGLEKGIDVVIKGFSELQQQLGDKAENVHLLILGKGNDADTQRLNAIIKKAGTRRIHFAGFQPDPESYFAAFDVFLHTPREENGATVLFEAMATGLPIVGSLIGGVPEAIIDNETGLLVKSDSPDLLADAASKLIINSTLRYQMGLNALRRCHQNFTKEHYVNRHVDFYREVLNSNN